MTEDAHRTPDADSDRAANADLPDVADVPEVDWVDFGAPDVRPWLARPKPGDDKYSRGVLGIMTGSSAYPGAAVLGVEGATRTGVGMVRYLGPGRATRMVLQRRPEVVTAEGRVQAWLVGSGMSAADRESGVRAELAEALASGHPAVVDAGALDLVGEATGPVVITPHAGELLTVLQAREVEVTKDEIVADPARWAAYAANLLDVTVLLKGHATHVVTAGSRRGFRVTAPTTELATAGSGDVLAGILGALLATHHADLGPDDGSAVGAALANLAATAAVLHGLAGERASGGGPIVALDIAHALPATIAALR
ncbi:ADP-dependent NAD(P)H-hydrate dehydratase [Subtercola sp. YIM 133946]|uniref:ADP-dependent NAD(P)H-hydrate dehydratase n=1 Tax=Subtercola sp. YIM 133946 TaxID=3118909 RepID=UPI002F94196F